MPKTKEQIIQMANYVGFMLEEAAKRGFKKIILAGVGNFPVFSELNPGGYYLSAVAANRSPRAPVTLKRVCPVLVLNLYDFLLMLEKLFDKIAEAAFPILILHGKAFHVLKNKLVQNLEIFVSVVFSIGLMAAFRVRQCRH